MQLQGRLRRTTLGDLLGTLYRARAHGVLELTETEGPRAGRAHRIHLSNGQVIAVDSETGFSKASPVLEQLEALFRLPDAAITFRVARPRPRPLPLPLDVGAYLHGRPRARDRQHQGSRGVRSTARSESLPAPSPRSHAFHLLGLPPDAAPDQIRRSFRRLARETHPDRFPRACPRERQALADRLAKLTEAYHLLMR